MADTKLVMFVESALRAGQPRDPVRAALEKAGWSKDQVADALAHYADVAFAVPVPRPQAQVSARDAFWYLLMFGTLYSSAYYLADLLFGFINLAWPDDLSYSYADRTRFVESGIRWATAAVIVSFPVFLLTAWKTGKEVAADPTRRNYAGIKGKRGELGGLHQTSPLRLGGALVILYSNDLEKTLAAVKAAGGKVVREPFAFPGGRRFQFKDPSGNELGVWSHR